MARSENQKSNRMKRWKRIKEQFDDRMRERTPSGAKPNSASVIDTLAAEWCLSVHTIEEILRKNL